MVAAKVKQGREKQVKDMISGKVLQRLAKRIKNIVFAHTKRSLEKLVKTKNLAQKKGNETFFIETYRELLWFARRQAEARKCVKYVLFAKAEQKLESIIKNVPVEQQREHCGGQSRRFSKKQPMFFFPP